MEDFELFLSFYGLLLGLSVAEVTHGLAGAVSARRKRKVGLLTPLLALFLLLDITALWILGWANREHVVISWAMMFGGLVVAVTYYLAASLVFPREPDDWPSLDDHYWAQKRYVFGGIAVANLVVIGFTVYASPLAWGDPVFAAWQAGYFVPLFALLFSRRRTVDLALLAYMFAFFALNAINIYSSDWGQATGL